MRGHHVSMLVIDFSSVFERAAYPRAGHASTRKAVQVAGEASSEARTAARWVQGLLANRTGEV